MLNKIKINKKSYSTQFNNFFNGNKLYNWFFQYDFTVFFLVNDSF